MAPLELDGLDELFVVGAPFIREVQTDAKLKKKKEVATLLGHSRAQNVGTSLLLPSSPCSS